MARHQTPRCGTSAPRTPEAGSGAWKLVAAAFAASVLLIAPVALWARVGDDGVLSTTAVALVAIGLCWKMLRRTIRSYCRRRFPARPALVAQTSIARPPSTLHTHNRQVTTAPRERRTASSHHAGPSRCRPVYISRGARDIGCRAGAHQLQRRSARRRTRP